MSSKINAISAGVGGLATSADASGILEIQTNDTTAVTVDGSQVVSFGNNFGTVAGLPSYQCRAWVNFNGTGTVAIRSSGNVSSISDLSVGNYTVNFTTAMPDAVYSVVATANNNADGGGYNVSAATYPVTTSAASVKTIVASLGTVNDVAWASVAILR